VIDRVSRYSLPPDMETIMGKRAFRLGPLGHGLLPLVLLAALAPAAIAHSPHTASCEEARRINGWCDAENAGYVASVQIRSRFLYEVLDAHGHEIIPAKVTCETCRKALATDGYCPAHKMGFVHGEAFMSSLTYHLARARTIDPEKITCPVCRKHTHGIGWCDADNVGIAGSFAVDDRQEFAELEKAYALLLAAVEMSSKCERCAGAMITDCYCSIHRVTYDKGRPIEGTPPS
jgi:hypothetical protein